MVFRQVMLTRVADYENDNVVFIQIAGDTKRGCQIRSARATTENAFRAPQLSRQFKRLAIGDVDYLIYVLHVSVGRHDFLANPFNEIRRSLNNLSRLFVVLEDRTIR